MEISFKIWHNHRMNSEIIFFMVNSEKINRNYKRQAHIQFTIKIKNNYITSITSHIFYQSVLSHYFLQISSLITNEDCSFIAMSIRGSECQFFGNALTRNKVIDSLLFERKIKAIDLLPKKISYESQPILKKRISSLYNYFKSETFHHQIFEEKLISFLIKTLNLQKDAKYKYIAKKSILRKYSQISS